MSDWTCSIQRECCQKPVVPSDVIVLGSPSELYFAIHKWMKLRGALSGHVRKLQHVIYVQYVLLPLTGIRSVTSCNLDL